MSRALSKANVPVSDFTVIEDNWKKVIPNLMYMLGDVCTQDNIIPTVNFGEYHINSDSTNQQKGFKIEPTKLYLSGVLHDSVMVPQKQSCEGL